jgi:hypothetical protein
VSIAGEMLESGPATACEGPSRAGAPDEPHRFRVLTVAAAPVRPRLPVIYSLIRSFIELDWSGDAAENRLLAGGKLLSVDDAARRHRQQVPGEEEGAVP